MRMRRLSLAAAAVVLSCSTSETKPPETFDFPQGFLFGTAIAGFQADMGCPSKVAGCIDPNSDWYDWVTKPSLVNDPTTFVKKEPVENGPGFYELYPQDLDRVKNELSNGALRLSIEWSRIFPTATDGVEGFDALSKVASADAIGHYHALFKAMRDRGVVPLVTLNHYSLPSWIHDAEGCHKNLDKCTRRGWLDHDRIVREIAKYSGFVAKEFGGDVDLWATLNEPLTAVAIASYLVPSETRSNPPGVQFRIKETRQSIFTMMEAHARMYDAVKANDTASALGGEPSRVGCVYNLEAVAPKDPNRPEDVEAAANLSYLLNEVFLNATVLGDVDEKLDRTTVHRDDMAGRMDYIGVNYYARVVAEGGPNLLPTLTPLFRATIDSLQVQDYNYSRGVYEVLLLARKWNLPLYITETGFNDPGDGSAAVSWLVSSLGWTKRAMDEGANVQGYFWWTLMDNYEWNHGMSFQMGMYDIDPKDPKKTRTPRPTVATYASIAGPRRIPDALVQQHLAPR